MGKKRIKCRIILKLKRCFNRAGNGGGVEGSVNGLILDNDHVTLTRKVESAQKCLLLKFTLVVNALWGPQCNWPYDYEFYPIGTPDSHMILVGFVPKSQPYHCYTNFQWRNSNCMQRTCVLQTAIIQPINILIPLVVDGILSLIHLQSTIYNKQTCWSFLSTANQWSWLLAIFQWSCDFNSQINRKVSSYYMCPTQTHEYHMILVGLIKKGQPHSAPLTQPISRLLTVIRRKLWIPLFCFFFPSRVWNGSCVPAGCKLHKDHGPGCCVSNSSCWLQRVCHFWWVGRQMFFG